MIGQTISHYKILEKLGEGGMGIVYKAHDGKLDRIVALKFLPQSLASDATERKRFEQEARVAAALLHPNIAVLYEIDECDGHLFLAMEYVEGCTLRDLIRQQELLPVNKILELAVQICEGLAVAHQKGVVHRDIKSDNIMVTSARQAKIMDFGLAKLRGVSRLTKAGSAIGTAAYMSPEQIQGCDVDARSDLFSFGVVLFEMLTGHLPFRGEHEAALLYSIVNEAPFPCATYRQNVSPLFDHIIARALEKDPADRYQHADDMVSELRRALKQSAGAVRSAILPAASGEPQSEISREQPVVGDIRQKTYFSVPTRWSIMAGIILLSASVVFLLFFPRRTPHINPNLTLRPLEVPYTIRNPGISRDGNWVTFNAMDANKEWGLYIMNVINGELRLVMRTSVHESYAEISPDMSQVLCENTLPGKPTGLYLIPFSGGIPGATLEGMAGRWQPDGQRIGYIKESKIREFWTAKPDGTDARFEFGDSAGYINGRGCFDWSPDGKSIAWLREFKGYREIIIHELGSGKERQITFDKKPIDDVAWAPNGNIFFAGRKYDYSCLWVIPASGGEETQVAGGAHDIDHVGISADGKRLLYQETDRSHHLWLAGIDGRNPRWFTSLNAGMWQPSLSPDERKILFIEAPTGSGRFGFTNQLYMVQNDGINRVPVTTGEGYHSSACWSPDGKRFTYKFQGTYEPADSSRIFLAEAQNFGTPILLGKGFHGVWFDNDKVVLLRSYPHYASCLYSIQQHAIVESYEDSTWQFPLHNGRHRLVYDERKEKSGWWLKTALPDRVAIPRLLLSSDFAARPSPSLHYLLFTDEHGKAWKMSLPEGKRERLPDLLDNLRPDELEFTFSWDDEQIIYEEYRSDARLILMENVFE